jgi:ComF family protein
MKPHMKTCSEALVVLARAVLSTLADALSPPSCAACDARLSQRSVFCAACVQTLSPVRAPLLCGVGSTAAQGIAFGVYGGALAVALRRLKYEERPDLAVPLGHLARRAAREAGVSGDVVVPVPLHPRRLAERGYNQAALLAAQVAIELDAPVAARALARVRHTPQQALLDRRGRLQNVAQAFVARAPEAVRGRRVVLVDDVATTGATLDACWSALLGAGAAAVTTLVVARAEGAGEPPPGDGVTGAGAAIAFKPARPA